MDADSNFVESDSGIWRDRTSELLGTQKTHAQKGGPLMLTIQDLSFGYHTHELVLDRFHLELQDGELLALMGASGCGKSTLLQLIAGFLKPSSGKLQCRAQKISYAFQEPRLFPWLTVEENLKAVLPKNVSHDQISLALKEVELEGCETLYPDELSGGMKSRVSLARALLYDGDLFLLDEPFSALDRELRMALVQRLRAYLKQNGRSAILVTHQAEDAELFADRLVIME